MFFRLLVRPYRPDIFASFSKSLGRLKIFFFLCRVFFVGRRFFVSEHKKNTSKSKKQGSTALVLNYVSFKTSCDVSDSVSFLRLLLHVVWRSNIEYTTSQQVE